MESDDIPMESDRIPVFRDVVPVIRDEVHVIRAILPTFWQVYGAIKQRSSSFKAV
jgi:hypothetical protein